MGETLDQAVRREVLEETGLIIEPVRIVEIFERMIQDAEGRTEYHYVLVDYLCRVTGGHAGGRGRREPRGLVRARGTAAV